MQVHSMGVTEIGEKGPPSKVPLIFGNSHMDYQAEKVFRRVSPESQPQGSCETPRRKICNERLKTKKQKAEKPTELN